MSESITLRERRLLQALQDIVLEAMDFSPIRRDSAESWLPPEYIEFAQEALALYGRRIEPLAASLSVSHRQPRQQLQPGAVRAPGLGRVGGHATVVVQVYALGRGVALGGQAAHLVGREGSFELEAHGVSLVVDPAGAVESHRLVTPVERYKGAIWQTVKAVDQEKLAEFGFGGAHGQLQAKTAILMLPQGSGKTLLAEDMAARLGCAWVVDGWVESVPLMAGALHLTDAMVDDLVEVAA